MAHISLFIKLLHSNRRPAAGGAGPDFFEEGRPRLLDAGAGIEEHGGRPGLPILAHGRSILGFEPLIEAEGEGDPPRRPHEIGQGEEFLPRERWPARRHERGNMEPADEGPHSAVVIFPRFPPVC